MKMPEDPFMLLSMVNMKLRDGEYEDLTEFCESEGLEEAQLVERLKEAGFEYEASQKQFR